MSKKSKTRQDLSKARQRIANKAAFIPELEKAFDDDDSVAYSFNHLQKKYDLDNKSLSNEAKIQLLAKIVKTTQQSWTQLILSGKGNGGIETIKRDIISNLPSCVTKDIQKLCVLRFASQKCRLIGFRRGNIFNVLYIDSNLSLYKH
ncbi:MAG: hypothetical protein Q4C83_01005 [Candidatus Saccharibacteria bacterium]|nr:hypothetical protein [Candidatus Saccharibacteria bacterium]